MKKILMAVTAMLITVSFTQAQDQPKSDKMEAAPAVTATPAAQTAQPKCDMKNCCMMKAGKMVCMKDGKEMPMKEDMKMANGSVMHMDGTMEMKDGKKMMMKDGECCDMNGNMGRMRMSHPATEKPAAPAK